MLKKILIIGIFLFSGVVYSQISLLKEFPFEYGEEGEYDAVYQWGFIKIRAGTVIFRVDSTYEDGVSYYQFSSTGVSKSKYDWIYTVRDTFMSKVRINDFQPIYYQRHTNEGDYSVKNETFFKEEQDMIVMHLDNNKKGYRSQTLPYQKNILDLQTAVYFARMLNFEHARIGDGFEFRIIIDGEPFTIPITYEGKETIELQKKKPINCYKISTHVIEGTIFKSGQSIYVWVKDDGSQVPVKVEAPIIVGKVQGLLKEVRINTSK
jgi:hypothetical protein